jgi:hypothetical protein
MAISASTRRVALNLRFRASISAVMFFGAVCADEQPHVVVRPKKTEVPPSRVVEELQERLGPDYRVAMASDPLDPNKKNIEIHSLTNIYFTVSSDNPPPNAKSDLQDTTEVITISPVESMDLEKYIKMKKRYYEAEERLLDWEKKLASVAKRVAVPTGNAARTLLKELHPATSAEKSLVDEFKVFVDEYTAAADADRDTPTHRYFDTFYQVRSLSDWGSASIEKSSLPVVLFADHVVQQVLGRLP